MDNETQELKIFDYCKKHGSITVRDAFNKLDINSPTKCISNMRRAGYDVKTVEEIRVKDSGKTVRYKRYFINERVATNG